jgi:hypothetical protein
MHDILAAEPAEPEIAARASRARLRALAAFDATPEAQAPWWAVFEAMPVPSAAALAVVLGLAAFLVSQRAPDAPLQSEARPGAAAPAANPRKARLEMNFQLSDGTKVRWVFNENFAL